MQRRHLHINQQFVLKIAAPTVAISMLLFALGIFAARNVGNIYLNSSNLIAPEVHGMISAPDLNTDMREIRYRLLLFAQTNDEQHLLVIPKIVQSAEDHLKLASQLAHTAQEREAVEIIRSTWKGFVHRFQQYRDSMSADDSATLVTLNDVIDAIQQVIAPTHDLLELNRDIAEICGRTPSRSSE